MLPHSWSAPLFSHMQKSDFLITRLILGVRVGNERKKQQQKKTTTKKKTKKKTNEIKNQIKFIQVYSTPESNMGTKFAYAMITLLKEKKYANSVYFGLILMMTIFWPFATTF